LHVGKRRLQNRRLGHQNVIARLHGREHRKKERAKPSFGPGSLDGVADFFTGNEADSTALFPRCREEDERRIVPTFFGFVDAIEIGGFFQGSTTTQTANRLRPLARRALMILRPFLVFIRARKPWVRLRGVLCG